jgi:hypothetical protein
MWMGVVLSELMSALLTLHGTAWAQASTTGAIGGTVRDSTGGVLPGVTVEASSPALIEKVRTVITDDQGNYKIIDLRPGTYTVTFVLAGFSTFKREGIELTTGFTATANAEMRVGALEETVTVTGASPVVDIQNIRQQTIISNEILETLPNGKNVSAFATLIIGAVQSLNAMDVGGNRGEIASAFGVHGSRSTDMEWFLDGMGIASGAAKNFGANTLSSVEVAVQTDNMTAEVSRGGPQLNYVPKEGGNTFKFIGVANYTDRHLQQSNLTAALEARGLPLETPIQFVYEYGAGLGGPIKRDRLWFYSGHRWWGNRTNLGGLSGGFFNKTQGLDSWHYTPDLSRPAYVERWNQDNNIRLTWKAAQKHKINLAWYYQDNCSCFANIDTFSGTSGVSIAAPEAGGMQRQWPNNFYIATWNYPASNRFLIEGGLGIYNNRTNVEMAPGVTRDHIAVTELSTGLRYRARAQLDSTGYTLRRRHTDTARMSASYITGSHAFKVGFLAQYLSVIINPTINGDVSYTFNRGVPVEVTQYATPWGTDLKVKPEVGIYAQDQWTVDKLTLNLGLRLDWLKAYSAGYSLPAGPFVPARDFPRVDNVPNWKDVSPRLGAAYDLFGDGRTAVKVALGKFVAAEQTGIASANAPATTYVNSATRTWNDANRDFIPQPDELGPLSNANFGKSVVGSVWAPDLLNGWSKREYNWQASASLQHELRPSVGVGVAYFRRWFGNFRVTDNILISPADYDPYCITAPVDPRLPGGGGNQICGLYDIRPLAFPLSFTEVTHANKFGEQTETFDGVDVTLNARFGRGGLLSAGVSTGRTVTDNCDALVDSPQKQFCHAVQDFSGQTQVKVNGFYPLPWDFQFSGTLQNLPGLPYTASYVATNSEIAPSLGRNLGACGTRPVCTSTAIVELIEPFTQYEPRITQLDVRFTRIFRFQTGRLLGNFDIYNVFNASPVLSLVSRFGPAWLQPTTILGGRLFKFGVQYDF